MNTNENTDLAATDDVPAKSPISSPILDAARGHLDELISESVKLKAKKDTAKTKAKKSYFDKKLKKNNDEAIRFMQGIDKIIARKEAANNG